MCNNMGASKEITYIYKVEYGVAGRSNEETEATWKFLRYGIYWRTAVENGPHSVLPFVQKGRKDVCLCVPVFD